MSRLKLHQKLPDLIGVSLSLVCLLHCLALPLVIIGLPSLGMAFNAHWVHQVLIGLAIPVSGWAVVKSGFWHHWQVGLPMSAGLLLLGLAAFAIPLEPYEAPISIVGAICLAIGHYRNTRLMHRQKTIVASGHRTD